MPESPLEDDQVDRPDVYVQQCTQLTGTNGRTLDHSYRVFPDRRRRFGDMPTTTTPYTCLPREVRKSFHREGGDSIFPVNISGRSHPFPSRTR